MFALSLTEDAVLRPLEPWRAEEFLTHLDRAREHIRPWVGPSFVAADLGSARAVLQRHADRWAADGGGIWGIWDRGTLVGGVLFVSFDAALGLCEVGCWLEPGAEGRGLVSRAVSRLVDWSVHDRGIQRVEWVCNARNERSIAVARRLGFHLDGTLRAKYPAPVGDGRIDMQVWSVLADEWRARGSDGAGRRAS
ncbi:GNAT family protein [Micromonospora sp. NPDC126480]|uniref:GNAT family N-acetyltransferase n=1 Tax=Micromonospora sp. NPDC126480 TaxID=3155312 RepID=UPI0033194168